MKRATILQRRALTLRLLVDPYRASTLNNLALALITSYDQLGVSEDLDDAIDLCWNSLHGLPNYHKTLRNLGLALCSRFKQTRKNENVKEAIRLCQESFEAFLSLYSSMGRDHTTHRHRPPA
ncbi:hypothetical protein F4604DRAFT_1768007 [Suillus subluteus]|nr:hypothetical protein F4604DRAFT_1768007 [Suillus subluteus]